MNYTRLYKETERRLEDIGPYIENKEDLKYFNGVLAAIDELKKIKEKIAIEGSKRKWW